MLVVKTTHLKAGWIRRNGMALSDKATMTERFIRHGNYMTHIYMIEDPYYFSEPLDQDQRVPAHRSGDDGAVPLQPRRGSAHGKRAMCRITCRGRTRSSNDYAKKHNIPVEATRGGAETALPEFMKKSRAGPSSGCRDSSPGGAGARGGGDDRWRPGRRRPCSRSACRATSGCSSAAYVNAAVQIGDDGVLVVDTMTEALAEPMVAEIKRLAGDKPIRWIINTHAHPDHTGGNAKVAAAGRSIIAGNFAAQAGQAAANYAQIIAHENAGNRAGRGAAAAAGAGHAGRDVLRRRSTSSSSTTRRCSSFTCRTRTATAT